MRLDRPTPKLISAALQRINEHLTRQGYAEVREAIQHPQVTEADIRQLVREFTGEDLKI